MCKFEISVSARTPSEIIEAERRLSSMPHVSSVAVSDDRTRVVAAAEMPGERHGQLKLTGWAKDNFGIHTTMNPCVRILA